ncbi:hypothetical protein [Alkaliphilus transvaalensis]|uniref:hypothetical protein n=1 Tax=Alkaliphilus transvaalensis TaxID=114628 RepID=UPI00047C4634|nr:hypothetical protein [Alkaliphilus transvaalensis]
MTVLAKLFALASVFYLVKVFLYPFYRPVSNKLKKRSRHYLNQKKDDKLKERFQRIKKYLAREYGKGLITNAERIRLKKIIERLDLNIQPEEVRIEQMGYALIAIIVTWVMYKANPLLGYVSAIFIILGWLYPVDELEKTIDRKNKNIALAFPAFYSMLYYQYSKSVNIYLADVIKDYLPNAHADMAEELGVMLDNIEYGEEFALKQLKKRVPIHYILKFCDIMETRLRGFNNISQMAYLKNELDEFRIRALEDELEKRQAENSRLQLVLILALGVYITLYYLFTLMHSFTMFQ